MMVGIGVIEGVECVILGHDPSVRAGAFNAFNAKKLMRGLEISRINRMPYVQFVESAGADLRGDAGGDPEAAMTIWAGATWKQTLGRFTFYTRNVSNFTAVRQFNTTSTDRIVLGKVDMLETDFGSPVVRLSRFVNASGDHTSAASKLLALGIVDDLIETRWAAQPYAEKLAKTGRNEKFLVTATAALACTNPKALFAWRPAS